MRHCDVVVVGAGLSGLWTARQLARRGVGVILADARSVVDDRVRTTGIFVRRTLEDYELPAGVLGRPIRRVVLYSPKGRALEMESRYDEFRVADMRALCRALLDDCMRAGVTWLPRTRYNGLRRADGVSFVRLGNDEVRTRFMVGADGARSKVARDLGLSTNSQFIVGIEEVYERAPAAAPSTLHCVLDPSIAPGYLAWVVHDGNQVHVGTAGDPRRFHIGPALAAFRMQAAGIADLSGAELVERRAGWIPVNGVLDRIACENGLLVGDAAGAPSPLTAGGLDPCVRLSDFGAHTIAEYLQAHSASALTKYSGRRFRARFISRRWMRACLSRATPATLELACAFLHLPGFRALAGHVFFGRGSFPDVSPRPIIRAVRHCE